MQKVVSRRTYITDRFAASSTHQWRDTTGHRPPCRGARGCWRQHWAGPRRSSSSSLPHRMPPIATKNQKHATIICPRLRQMMSDIHFFPRDAMLERYMLSLCVCPSGCHKPALYLRKGKEAYLYSAFYIYAYLKALRHGSQFYLQRHHACLSFVCVHQIAPALTGVRDI